MNVAMARGKIVGLMAGIVLLVLLVGCASPQKGMDGDAKSAYDDGMNGKEDSNRSINGNESINGNGESSISQGSDASGQFLQQKPQKVVRHVYPARQVRILGRQGFTPAEMTVKIGEKIILTNEDPEGRKVELVFQYGTSRQFITTTILDLGEEHRQIFEEPGTYHFWTTGYGKKGKIMVK